MFTEALKYFRRCPFRDMLTYGLYHLFYVVLLKYYSTAVFWIFVKLLGVRLGAGPQIWGKIRLVKFPGSTIEIGDRFRSCGNSTRATASTVNITKLRTFLPSSRILIGNDVGLSGTSIVCRSTMVKIGDGTRIGPNCSITDSDIHCLNIQRRDQPCVENDRPVIIGKNVFIGMGAIILKGVTIGDNSIVGAGSIVVKDVEPNSIYAGNPARFIRKLEN